MNEDIKQRASVNSLGNGALPGSMGNAGTSTGMNAGIGCDIGMDATNSMGRMSAEDSGSSPYAEKFEETHDFMATKNHSSAPGRMGGMGLSD